MAGKAAKKQAKSNLKVLRLLYCYVVPIVCLALLRTLLSRNNRTPWTFVLVHMPLGASLWLLERSGRPRARGNGQFTASVDLDSGDGLVQYLFDIVYLSLFADCGRIVLDTNKFWHVLWVCPVYAVVKLWGLIRGFLGSRTVAQNGAVKKSER